MKTNEQIVLALQVCKRNSCSKRCPYHGERACYVKLHSDARILITQLEHDPARRGVWKHDGKKFEGGIDWYHCSECNCAETGVYVLHPYCSMCGAKMDAEV